MLDCIKFLIYVCVDVLGFCGFLGFFIFLGVFYEF